MSVCVFVTDCKSPKVLHRLLWNLDTTLHSTPRMFLRIHTYYHMDVTPVTGKTMLFTMLFVQNSAICWTFPSSHPPCLRGQQQPQRALSRRPYCIGRCIHCVIHIRFKYQNKNTQHIDRHIQCVILKRLNRVKAAGQYLWRLADTMNMALLCRERHHSVSSLNN